MYTPEQLFLNILVSLFFGGLCGVLAKKQGRSPMLWFTLGVLFSFFALIVLIFLPSPVQRQDAASSSDDLKLHRAPVQVEQELKKRPWYYLDAQHEQQGPVEESHLRVLWEQGVLKGSSYVWQEGMSDWKPVEEVEFLKSALEPK